MIGASRPASSRGDVRRLRLHHHELILRLSEPVPGATFGRFVRHAVWADKRDPERADDHSYATSRLNRWMRVWASLAGEDIDLFDSPPTSAKDRIAWVMGELRGNTRTRLGFGLYTVGVQFPDSRSPRGEIVPRETINAYIQRAVDLGPGLRSYVAVGIIGDRGGRAHWAPKGATLPRTVNSVRRIVRRQFRDAEQKAAELAARHSAAGRLHQRRFDYYPAHLAAYLLKKGFRVRRPNRVHLSCGKPIGTPPDTAGTGVCARHGDPLTTGCGPCGAAVCMRCLCARCLYGDACDTHAQGSGRIGAERKTWPEVVEHFFPDTHDGASYEQRLYAVRDHYAAATRLLKCWRFIC